MSDVIILCISFFFIALVYSSAGFGGGSSYLAVLSFFELAFTDLRVIALCCNIIVVLGSTILFHKNIQYNWKRVIPLVILSIPLAFLGGRFQLSEKVFFIILGFCLLLAAIVMLIGKVHESRQLPKYSNAVIGGGIGFLSGVVGIGGGIFLSPILHLSRWARPKVIASTSALFILVNSVAGLLGQLSTKSMAIQFNVLIPLLICVFIGGQIGVRSTIFKFSPILVKKITAIVILVVAIRILAKYLF